jgi:hypothetical protein
VRRLLNTINRWYWRVVRRYRPHRQTEDEARGDLDDVVCVRPDGSSYRYGDVRTARRWTRDHYGGVVGRHRDRRREL